METEIKNELENRVSVQMGFGTVEGARALWKAASYLAKSDIIPDTYKGKEANCLIALNIANRIQADPLMVMQNLYMVYGRPSWSSKFKIATFNSNGRYSAIRYEMSGKEGSEDWGCRAWAVETATGERLTGTKVTMGMAKKEGWYDKKGSKWQTMPEKMLRYRAASFFIDEVAPEISCGMSTAEEIEDTITLQQNTDGTYEAMKDEVQAKAASVDVGTIDPRVTPTEAAPY